MPIRRAPARVAAATGAIAVANLAVVLVYELATWLAPETLSGWRGLAASAVAAAVTGALAGIMLVRLHGGALALMTLSLLVLLEAAVSAHGLSSVGNGYASWRAEGVQPSVEETRWLGWVCALSIGLAGGSSLQRRQRNTRPSHG